MTDKNYARLLKIQRDFRSRMVAEFQRRHGVRLVEFAFRHLDYLVRKYPSGMVDVPKLCRELRERRHESRSWSLASEIYIELLKQLVTDLEAMDRPRSRMKLLALLPGSKRAIIRP